MSGLKINHSPIIWSIGGAVFIALAFYLVQVLGMQSWSGPLYFMKAKWYFILPLIITFSLQLGLFKALQLQAQKAGQVVVATGSVSTTTMAACCLHNLVIVFPFLGLSGLAVFFSIYQNYVFMFSILLALTGVAFMWKKYYYHKIHCHLKD